MPWFSIKTYQKFCSHNNFSYFSASVFMKALNVLQYTPDRYLRFVGNKAKGRISKRVFQENKARQIFRKTNISYPLIYIYIYMDQANGFALATEFSFMPCQGYTKIYTIRKLKTLKGKRVCICFKA